MNKQNKSNKKTISIRYQLLSILASIAIIPLIVIIAFVSVRVSSLLKNETEIFYSELLEQINNNIDFSFDQHAMTFNDITMLNNFDKIINHPPFKSKEEEINIFSELGETGDLPTGGSIWMTVFAKFKGFFIIIDLDKKSLVHSTNYMLYPFSAFSTLDFNTDKIFDDKLYKRLRIDKKMVFGKLDKGTFNSFDSEKRSVFLYPYFKKGKKEFREILLLVNDSQFGSKFYKNIDKLKFGTLYILDANDNIISRNHPNTDIDYYNFDKKQRKYTLQDGDDPNDPYEPLSFNDYKLLNTDAKILQSKNIKKLLKEITNENYNYDKKDMKIKSRGLITVYNNVKYLTITAFSNKSNVKLIYFHPIKHIYKPVNNILKILIIITIMIIIIILFISVILSYSFTNPIKTLSVAASQLAIGDYNIDFKIKSRNEINDLANSFKKMAGDIKARDIALKEANIQLKNLDKVKSMFFHSAEHQLRTPFHQIIANNELLLNRNFDPYFDLSQINSEILEILVKIKHKNSNIIKLEEFFEFYDKQIFANDLSFFDYYYLMATSLLDIIQNKDGVKEIDEINELLKESNSIYNESIDKTKNIYKSIKRSGDDITKLLDSLSDISNFDAILTKSTRTEIDIHKFIDQIIIECEEMLEKYNKKGIITIKKNIDNNIENPIYIHEFNLRIVLKNLLSNAIKFSNKGTVNLNIEEIFDEKSNKIYLLFTVTDKGIGIQKKDFDKIFTEFGRAQEVYKIDGIGLGLTLSKIIVELINGEIGFKSVHKKGSSFWVKVFQRNLETREP